MKQTQKCKQYTCNNLLLDKYVNENTIFFDIETTGFSPVSSICYLIGTLQKKNNLYITNQFLASDINNEKEIILSFLNIIIDKTTLITFNGQGFDLPFIEERCKYHGITFDFSAYQHIDIYKLVCETKRLLKLENYKQKTIEAFLGISRDDQYSGGELITVYEEYTKSQDQDLEELLLLHNYEDVIGMLDLLPVLTYREFICGEYTLDNAMMQSYESYEGESNKEFIITLKNRFPVPNRITYFRDDFYITMINDITKIRVPVYEGTLHYFYPNYRDYYYLPKEDMAIHKSVATYVDKEFRIKAKATNCYTRKSGVFLPQFDDCITPVFRKELKDSLSYFEYTDDFISSTELLTSYVNHILMFLK